MHTQILALDMGQWEIILSAHEQGWPWAQSLIDLAPECGEVTFAYADDAGRLAHELEQSPGWKAVNGINAAVYEFLGRSNDHTK